MSTRHKGKLTSWKDDRGFGFITPDGGGEQVFVHISGFAGDQQRPSPNTPVIYATMRDEQGRIRAVDVRFAGASAANLNVLFAGVIVLIFFGCLALLIQRSLVPLWSFAIYALMSGITFAAYRQDKQRALDKGWRISEQALHLLEFLGGWPGALIAQWYYHHKNRKFEYQLLFWGIIALNLIALAALSLVSRSLG